MSFGILRTNVGLTTNAKIMVSSNYQLSIDSIESNDRLSLSRFKNFKFNKSTAYDDIIPIYYKNIPSETAFQIKNNSNKETITNNFKEQFDDLYIFGAKNIENNKDYEEYYEYFAPLYIDGDLPTNFVIFRVDGSGIEKLTKENFRSNILDNLKAVKTFDLTNKTNFGQWLSLNFKENIYFPKSPVEIDFRNLEFSKWNGIDYESGGYTSKSFLMDNIFDAEKEIFELEKFVFDRFKENKVVFPNILNISFLFNDVPSTPDVVKKWSINRYYGFYLDDMELSYTISPYRTPKLRSDVVILEDNILFSDSNPNNPFEKDWSNSKPFYIEYKGEYYLVRRYTEERGERIQKGTDDGFISEEYRPNVVNFYKIISEIDLQGEQNQLNKNYGYISDDVLIFEDTNTLSDYETADVWLIEIDGLYHKLIKDSDSIKINSDYAFTFNKNSYEYKVASSTKNIGLDVDFNNKPKKFSIYKCKFSDIKDFDTKIIDTEYSKFEYEKKDDLTITDETKMYLDDLSTDTNPKSVDDFRFKNEVVNIPVSSEYTANFETFKITENGLSDIWQINPIYCRWVFKNSLSANDYPYVMNNSNVFELFNRTTNVFESEPNRSERNLDYFYTINSSTASYTHHTLHIESVNDGEIDTEYKFDEDKYLNIGYDYDYFTYFFERKAEFDNSNIKRNVKKHSVFNKGDSSTPNISLFRGMEFRMYNIDSIILDNNNDIETVNIENSNDFDDYKLSILLTEEDNGISWQISDDWKMNKEYNNGDVVLFDDILYTATESNKTDFPVTSLGVKTAPYNLESWTYSSEASLGISYNIFWNPTKIYDLYDFVYNSGDYYVISLTSSNIDFWNPITAQESGGYSLNDIVLFKGDYYQSMTSSNIYPPDFMLNKTPSREFQDFDSDVNRIFSDNESLPSKSLGKYWEKVEKPLLTKWEKIEIWNPSGVYFASSGVKYFVYHNDKIWSTQQVTTAGLEPGISNNWVREYSIIPNNEYVYKNNDNAIIQLNNRYYIVKDNPFNKTLDNGIKIYINKKWENILINIKINDNTLPNLSNSDRDNLYDDIYKSLTALNFISSINEFYNKFGFSNYLEYVIIDENNSVEKYSSNNNIVNLPYLLGVYAPDEISVRFSALSKTGFKPDINVNKKLNNGEIENLSQLNWYNDIPIAYRIEETENTDRRRLFKNYSGLRNQSNVIFRFSGDYMPLFYDIDLFDKNTYNKKHGNYKFDTSLTYFGVIKEVKMRKVNRSGSLLKLNSTNNVSMYPMVDEFGYTFSDLMIFKSNWDLKYHIETTKKSNVLSSQVVSFEPDTIEVPQKIGQSKIVKIQNSKNYNL